MPERPISGGTRIPDEQYKGRTDLTEFTVPEGVQEIGEHAFADCTNLRRITLPDTLRKISAFAFINCMSLAEIRIPDSVTEIGPSAFFFCTSLKHFRFPRGMNGRPISHSVLGECGALETVEMPERTAGTLEMSFYACRALRKVVLPDGVEKIGRDTFSACNRLEEIYIPPTVRIIGSHSFAGCMNLRTLIIPDSVTEIYEEAFVICTQLELLRLPVGVRFCCSRIHPRPDEVRGAGGCFLGAYAIQTVILGTKTFLSTGELTDDALLLMHAALAADGDRKAMEFVRKDRAHVMQLLDNMYDPETKAKLLRCGI